jgi:hypothetical protein
MIFKTVRMRFEFEAKDVICFSPGKAANTFRGALGSTLHDTAYARLFAPRGDGAGPSGFDDRPRPFVLRAAALDGQRFEPGERFALDVNGFEPNSDALECFQMAFDRLANEGLGASRGRVQLVQATQIDTIAIDLAASTVNVGAIRVQFVTPMELKSGGEVVREPRFDVLFPRVRDRISSLCSLYQGGAPEVDYPALGERAHLVTTSAVRIEDVDVERRSSRTGQRHGLGGFVGEADYAGELGEFLPWLKVAEWTGAGRLTVWGNGALLVRNLAGVPGNNVAVQSNTGRGGDTMLGNSKARD